MTAPSLRNLPSVEALLQMDAAARLISLYGRALTLDALRTALAAVRQAPDPQIPTPEQLMDRAAGLLQGWLAPTLRSVINATGVVLHTNLGRAPLSRAALQAVQEAGGGYTTLEFDLERGARGARSLHAETLLTRLTGAEAALVVNNNAAAVLLVLSALAKGKNAVISRTQLVEIGGGFRVPEVMRQSGARLMEIGATNRVHLEDYEAALAAGGQLVLHAHPSNFRIIGFSGEPPLAGVAAAAHRAGVWLVDDLGSGALLDTARWGLAHEPTVAESLAAGADLVCFSGDKLLGGPQAGIIVGQAGLVARLKKHPLMRAVRPDKLCLAALAATLGHYLKGEAEREVPVWRMIAADPGDLQQRARQWAQALGQGEVLPGESTIGGGSLPGETRPTWLLALPPGRPNRLLADLRAADPPVIARIETERVVLDPRTVLPEQDGPLLAALNRLLTGH